MTEQEFLVLCEHTLEAIEEAIDACGASVDASRNERVLELEFDDSSKIIVNGNAPVREVWVAAKSGGFHFKREGNLWVNTRSAEELFDSLSRLVSLQSGEPVVLRER